MGKIKLNLVSGAVVEKPLISAFKANNNSYIILDNEVTGSMGLPIILVCKYENEKVIKINDQNEWQIVKEYLKNIIAGNNVEYFAVKEELTADDIYYTQLTLPVPSFDALKNAYHVDSSTNEEIASILGEVQNINPEPIVTPEVQPEAPAVNIPVNPIIPEAPVIPSAPAVEMPSAPVVDINMPTEPVVEPVVEQTTIPETPVMPTAPVVEMPSADVSVESSVVEPEITPTPVIETPVNTTVSPTSDDMFKEQKEAFMQACENMFDALVQKFQKELENRK